MTRDRTLGPGPATHRRASASVLVLALLGAISAGHAHAQIGPSAGFSSSAGTGLTTSPLLGTAAQFDPAVRLGQLGRGPRDPSAPAWLLVPFIGLGATFTDNVDLAPAGDRQSDLVLTATPGLRIRGRGARVSLEGVVQAQGVVGFSDAAANRINPQVALIGNVEAVEKLFFLEGAVNVSQQYLSPFGPTPPDNINATDNRYTNSSYRVSPYLQGIAFGDTTFLLRDDNIWTNLSGNPTNLSNAYYNNLVGQLFNAPDPGGWAVDYNYTYTKFQEQEAFVTRLARFRPIYRLTSQVEVSASGGYEWRDYPFERSSNAIYGAGFRWRPTERTELLGAWEQRFFGPSYLASFTHRTPQTAWNLAASRNINSFPQLAFVLPAGGDVFALLDAAFTTRVTDPAQRQQAVEAFIRQTGLPPQLASPVSFYSQQVILQETQSATVALIGARNVTAFTLYNRKNRPVSGASGAALPPVLDSINDNTQTGGSVTWSHRLTGLSNLVAIASYARTEQNAPFEGETTQRYVQLAMNTRLSPRTYAWVGVRYQTFDSNVSPDYTEAALFVGLSHSF